jgi:hypothetical protein
MRNWFTNISISAFSVLFTLFLLELGLRVYTAEYGLQNFLEIKRNLFRAAYPSEFDAQLGWVPMKGEHPDNVWNTEVTILADGIRSNGKDRLANESTEKGQVILAVGDSFTFGDQVSNEKTWPAMLEKISATRVINGGVFGYGIDQSYLRMLDLAAKYRPDVIIFSFIPDDIYRCELSERTSVPKPYFEISDGGELVLMNEHMPPHFPSESSLDLFRKIAGYSYLAHKLALRLAPEYWLQGSWAVTQVHSEGAKVACRIFEQLEEYGQREAVQMYILVQYEVDGIESDIGAVDEAMACVDQGAIRVVDLRSSLAELKASNIKQYKRLFYGRYGHMTPAGNAFVASRMWEEMGARE